MTISDEECWGKLKILIEKPLLNDNDFAVIAESFVPRSLVV